MDYKFHSTSKLLKPPKRRVSQLPLIRELPAKETQEGEAPVKEEHICEKHEIISSLLQSTWSCLQEILEDNKLPRKKKNSLLKCEIAVLLLKEVLERFSEADWEECKSIQPLNPLDLVEAVLHNAMNTFHSPQSRKFREKLKLLTYNISFLTEICNAKLKEEEFITAKGEIEEQSSRSVLIWSDEDYKLLSSFITVVKLGKDKKVIKEASKVADVMKKVNSSFAVGHSFRNPISAAIATGSGALLYSLSPKLRSKKFELLQTDINKERLVKVWNLPETKPVRLLSQLSLPRIAVHKVIEIPPPVNENIPNDYNPTTIRARFISPVKLKPKADVSDLPDTLIIHFHGGGFISMSSATHSDYTRMFSNTTGIPVLSIDYRLAPAYPYPTPFLDCFYAYKWAISNAASIGYEPSKFILTGDSAGGNLAAAVTMKAIMDEIQLPNGVLLSYPALNLNSDAFLPSRILSVVDGILPYAFLKIALHAYNPPERGYDAHSDPFLSPVLASENLLQKFPPTCIHVGTADPLYDDSIQLAKRLVFLKRPVRLTMYENLPHGYLSFVTPGWLSSAKKVGYPSIFSFI